ncbi:MAG TPA: NINE protein [Edaphobacter sp.]
MAPLNFTDPIYTAGMTEHQRAWFYAEYNQAHRDEVVGVLLAIFLGSFGLHHFYLRRNGLGILYLLFSWTGIPAILGFIEAFFMPGRVRAYNAMQAAYIASQIRASAPFAYQPPPPASGLVCAACGAVITPGAGFCPRCGVAIAGQPLA